MNKPLVFITLPTGCYVPTSHKLNIDGYFRKRWGDETEMFHRFIWRAHGNEIPEGHEIDHLCNNRSCCNVKHLQCIPRIQHLVETNSQRYLGRKAAAFKRWLEGNINASQLAREFGVTSSSGSKWVREWRKL